jgi:rfaE bifunctional protein kinase chain/domain
VEKIHRRFRDIVRKFPQITIGVLGDYMLDELLEGEATRISPEAPVPVVVMNDRKKAQGFPGGAGNVAANLAALGGRPIPFGAIGKDASGKRLTELLKQRRILHATLVREPGRVTPHKMRIAAHQQQLLRLDVERPENISSRTVEAVVRSFGRWVGKLQALIISDYRKGTLTTELSNQIKALARQRRLPIFVDPKPEHPELCRHATMVTPNLREAELMAGFPLRDRHQIEMGGRRLLATLQCSYLLITRGAEGMTLFDAEGATREIPSVPRPVYDVTGAGDTVLAVLALAYAAGATMLEAAELANLAAGRVVLKFGTAEISPRELLEAVTANFQGSRPQSNAGPHRRRQGTG